MKQPFQAAFIPWRFYLLIIFIFFLVLGLILRLIDLAVIDQSFLEKQGNARALRTVTEPVFRGMITDRNGYPLAISTTVYSVWMNPKEFTLDSLQLKRLSQLISVRATTIQLLFQQYKNKNREFVYLKRHLSPELASKIKALVIPGVYCQQEYKRYYPEGEIAAHLVGFTNIDDRGQEGVELAYDQWLTGTPGKKQVIKDRLGRIVSDVKKIQDQKSGADLVLSINRKIQYLAYRELLNGVKINKAESGSVIVLDVKTGEVLAMVNQPSFNPNNYSAKESDSFRNRAVTDTFEPGSTMKAFSISAALDSGQYKMTSMIDTHPGWLRVGRHLVRDEHNNGSLNIAQILQLSSNVGVTKVILSLQPDRLWNVFHRVGFGETTDVGFPGERSGVLVYKKDPFALATLAFGYGLSVTPIQLAQAYAILANGGVKIPLTLLRLNKLPVGKRVMDEKVAKEMLSLLETVVLAKEGTGRPARVPGYHVAGKTGTAKMVKDGVYEKHRYVASFVGIAPLNNPRLVVAVIIRDPRGKEYYGGLVSGPVFEKIMEGSLRTLNIPPDDLHSLNETSG